MSSTAKSNAELEYDADPTSYNAVTMFCKGGVCEKVKLFCGFVAVTLLILVVITGIILQYCVLKIHPALAFLICTFPATRRPVPRVVLLLALPPPHPRPT